MARFKNESMENMFFARIGNDCIIIKPSWCDTNFETGELRFVYNGVTYELPNSSLYFYWMKERRLILSLEVAMLLGIITLKHHYPVPNDSDDSRAT